MKLLSTIFVYTFLTTGILANPHPDIVKYRSALDFSPLKGITRSVPLDHASIVKRDFAGTEMLSVRNGMYRTLIVYTSLRLTVLY